MSLTSLFVENAGDVRHLSFLFPLRYVASSIGIRLITLKIRDSGAISFRPAGSSDVSVLRQVFKSRDYDLSVFPQYPAILDIYDDLLAQGRTPIIVDAGANIGASSIWFARRFPASTVIAIEPEPQNAELCRNNTNRLGNVIVLESALGATGGNVALSDPGVGSWGFRTKRDGSGLIPVVTMREIGKMVPCGGLFIVKLDIEGFESEVFSGDTSWLDDVTALIVEPHDRLLPGMRTSRSLQRCVAQRDFDLLISGENLVYVRVLPTREAGVGLA